MEGIQIKNCCNKFILKMISTLFITLLLILCLSLESKAAKRVIYDIDQISLSSYKITLSWSGSNSSNLLVNACAKKDDNTVIVYYKEYAEMNKPFITIDINELDMKLSLNKPNVILESVDYSYNKLLDLPEDGEMKNAIENLYYQGVINGYDDRTFKHYIPITKEEFCSMFLGYMNYDLISNKDSKYLDVKNDRWSKNIIMTLTDYGVITGQDDGNFGVNKNISLGEISAMIVRARGLTNLPSSANLKHLNKENWANNYITIMVQNGLIKEDDSFYFEECQNKTLTRGEVSLILNRS